MIMSQIELLKQINDKLEKLIEIKNQKNKSRKFILDCMNTGAFDIMYVRPRASKKAYDEICGLNKPR